MRTLKLRYFYKGKFYYIDLYKDNTRIKFEEYEKRPKTSPFEQFTGLLDKSGKEIYEGDIVKAIYPSNAINKLAGLHHVFVIEWENRYPHDNFLGYNLGFFDSIEIIGNIYENPELLGG